MTVEKLNLKNFRNYISKELSFSKDINIIIGKNGAGKTNILEALYILSHGKSWRTRYDFELINFNVEVANIKAKSNGYELFVGLEKTYTRRTRKLFKINNISKSFTKFTAVTKSVVFSPQDLDIIIGSPSHRRNFLNEVLTQVDEDYRKKVLELKKVVQNRNKLLERVNEGLSKYSELEYWNNKLILNSQYIHNSRTELIDFINSFLEREYKTVSNCNSVAKVIYSHSIADKERILKYKEAEIGSRRTLVGAHKDDLEVSFQKGTSSSDDVFIGDPFLQGSPLYQDTRYYASRGEQRTLVFVLKLAALEYIKEKTRTGLILLLDDVYSELDEIHRATISKYFEGNQVFITSAEVALIPPLLLQSSKIIEL